jgi:hypothetical protein
MNIIFLDIDGVLKDHYAKEWFDEANRVKRPLTEDDANFNQDSVDLIKDLQQKFKTKIVICSMWRFWGDIDNFIELFALYDWHLTHDDLDMTTRRWVESTGSEVSRYKLIMKYVNEHPEIQKYVILDDVAGYYPSMPKELILTNAREGFKQRHYERAVEVLSS